MNTKNINISFLIAVFIAWFIVFFQGITTAIKIWNISEIFTHCFFVLPCAFYFIFKKRHAVFSHTFTPNYWLASIIAGTLFVNLFGTIGSIQLFTHLAAFSSLPLIIWMLIGNKAAKEIAFPLFLMLFSIPVGEELIPFLQELTTDLAVPLLNLTNVPIYRNGLYLDIPEGRFLVAEACSGISFLIASLVFGLLYMYISFSSYKKRVLFIALSIIVPILANAVRVYGIILTAHLTDMEYAAGADHIIYGGIFYAIIIFILIVIGERIRDKNYTLQADDKNLSNNRASELNKTAIISIILLLSSFSIWQYSISTPTKNATEHVSLININAFKLPFDDVSKTQWQPSYKQFDELKQGQLTVSDNQGIDLYIALYRQGELISSQNRLYSNDRWTLLSKYSAYISKLNTSVVINKVISANGKKRLILHWYKIGDKRFASNVKAKLYRTFHQLFGMKLDSALVAFSIELKEPADEQGLIDFLNQNAEKISMLFKKAEG